MYLRIEAHDIVVEVYSVTSVSNPGKRQLALFLAPDTPLEDKAYADAESDEVYAESIESAVDRCVQWLSLADSRDRDTGSQ